jgi:hypothetical protein
MLESLLNWLISLVVSIAAPVVTLNSIEQVDDYPLYVMHTYGDAEQNLAIADYMGALAALPGRADRRSGRLDVFAVRRVRRSENALLGQLRLDYSPAVLLINHLLDG